MMHYQETNALVNIELNQAEDKLFFPMALELLFKANQC